jgi:hypothetical protein
MSFDQLDFYLCSMLYGYNKVDDELFRSCLSRRFQSQSTLYSGQSNLMLNVCLYTFVCGDHQSTS